MEDNVANIMCPTYQLSLVLTHLDRRQIPKRNILRPWTKWYDEGNNNREYINQLAIENEDLKKRALISKAFEVANKEARISNLTFQQAMEALTQNDSPAPTKTVTSGNEDDNNNELQADIPTSLPPSTFKGGRRPSTGQRSWLDNINKEKRQRMERPRNKLLIGHAKRTRRPRKEGPSQR